jgi:hypothetical protein
MESLKNVVGVYGFVILGCESVSVKLIHKFFFFWESLKAPDTIQIDYNKINNIQFGY